MWPRVAELMIACWLLVTPLVFRGTAAIADYALSSAAAGTIVALIALLDLSWHLRFARFVTLAVGIGLIVHGYVSAARPGPPAAQNELVAGLMLMMFAVLPNHVNQPPRPWRRHPPRS
jgi:hypothetical protein